MSHSLLDFREFFLRASLQERLAEMRRREERCRKAYAMSDGDVRDYSLQLAEAYGEAAQVFERALMKVDDV